MIITADTVIKVDIVIVVVEIIGKRGVCEREETDGKHVCCRI